MIRRPPRSTRTDTLFPYTTLFRSLRVIFMQYANSVDQRKYQIVKVKSEMAHKVDPTRTILEVAKRLLRLNTTLVSRVSKIRGLDFPHAFFGVLMNPSLANVMALA